MNTWDGREVTEVMRQSGLEWAQVGADEIERLRDALEDYACYGLGRCKEPRLKDGSCVRMDCGDRARRALDGQSEER